MDKTQLIKRMRDVDIKWKDIAYVLDMNISTAQMALKKFNDIQELGEKPVVKSSKFEAKVILKLKELARNNVELSIRDLRGELGKIFPESVIPSATTIHGILKGSGFKMLKLLKKTLIWPRNQLKRVQFCEEMANYGPAFWDTVIWSDETTVRQCPKDKEVSYRVHSSVKKEDLLGVRIWVWEWWDRE